jgi:DNA-binding SARP family transcriptional activator
VTVATTDRTTSSAPAADTEPYSLRLLRGFELRRGEAIVRLPMSGQRLAAFLALHGRRMQRVYVAGVLWIDSTEEQANANLRTALWRLRQAGSSLVDVTSTHLGLADDVPVDARDIAGRAQRVLQTGVGRPDDLERLAQPPELLPDWYDDWVVVERERLRQRCVQALEQLSRTARERGRFAEAAEAGLAAVALEPLRESAHRVVIEAHLAQGNAADALRQFRLFEDLLARDLGLRPTPLMDELMRSVTMP